VSLASTNRADVHVTANVFSKAGASTMEEATNRRILNGWKQISNHLDRGVRTAQRWEALLGMPVHRPALKDRSAVVAFSDELESWLSRTSPHVRNECVATDDQATRVNDEWNKTLRRALDNLSTLVGQSCDLLSQVQMLQEQLRRSRKSRRVASRTIAARPRGHQASRRSAGSVLPFPHRKHLSRIERTVFAGMVDLPGFR
jgi:hypothetical protein